MQSETVVLLFDIIILILGIYALVCALRMKRTGIPSAILLPKEELPKIKNAEVFCRKMYRPTILFGVVICLYGVIDILNRSVLKIPFADFFGMACFLIACIWYIKKLQEVKGEHL